MGVDHGRGHGLPVAVLGAVDLEGVVARARALGRQLAVALDDQDELVREPGIYTSHCHVPGEFLNHGQYYVAVISDSPNIQYHFQVDPALAFQIAQTGGAGGHINDDRKGMLRMQLPWKFERNGPVSAQEQQND